MYHELSCFRHTHILRPPLAQPDIPWPRQRALPPLDEIPIPHLPHNLSLAEHDLTSNNGIPWPVLELNSLERRVIDRMVQHTISKCKRLEQLLRVPDGNVGVEARSNGSFLLQSIQLGRVGRRDLDELLRRDSAGEDARE